MQESLNITAESYIRDYFPEKSKDIYREICDIPI
jgi:hypothetical protein